MRIATKQQQIFFWFTVFSRLAAGGEPVLIIVFIYFSSTGLFDPDLYP